MYEFMLDDVVAGRIQRSLPSLTTEQIHAALEYWRSHRKEIESLIEEEQAILDKLPPGH